MAGLIALAVAGCREPHEPPPTFEVFYLTDKFFDIESFGDGRFITLGYRTKVMQTEDNGATWEVLHDKIDDSMTRFSFLDENVAVGVGHRGTTYRTEDGGKTWDIGSTGAVQSLFNLSIPDGVHGWAVGDLASVPTTSDGGKTWQHGVVPIFEDGKPIPAGVRPDMTLAIEDPIYYGVHFLDAQTGWIVGEYGQIRHTTDGGKEWSYQHDSLLNTPIRYLNAKDTPPVRDMMTLPTFFSVKFRDRMNGIIVGTYGAIATTNDGGKTWTFNESPVRTPLYEIRYLPDGDAIIVGSDGVLVRGNAQDGWKLGNIPPGIYTWLASAAFADDGHGLVTGGYGTILTTDDFGKTWSQTLYQ